MKLVIFDIDATLVYSDKVDSKAFASTYQAIFGFDFPSINWNDYPHVTDETIFETVYAKHLDKEPLIHEKESFRQAFVDKLVELRQKQPQDFLAVDGAVDIVNYLLKTDGYIVGIATGGWKAPALLKLQHVGIDPSLLYCGFADDNYTREAIITEAINHAKAAGHPITDIVYVGDAKWDVTTTRNMNIPLIGIRYQGDVDLLYQLGTSHVITNYKDQDRFMQLLNEAEVPK